MQSRVYEKLVIKYNNIFKVDNKKKLNILYSSSIRRVFDSTTLAVPVKLMKTNIFSGGSKTKNHTL